MKIGHGSKIYDTARVLEYNRVVEIGVDCIIGDLAFVAARKLVMEDGSQISPHAIIGGGGDVILGKYSVVGFGAMLLPATDSPSAKYMCEAAPLEDREIIRGSITLGEGAYVGAGAVICVSKKHPNITIGDYSVVGSLSYIDKSFPANIVVHSVVRYVKKKRHTRINSNKDQSIEGRR